MPSERPPPPVLVLLALLVLREAGVQRFLQFGRESAVGNGANFVHQVELHGRVDTDLGHHVRREDPLECRSIAVPVCLQRQAGSDTLFANTTVLAILGPAPADTQVFPDDRVLSYDANFAGTADARAYTANGKRTT